jgi:hypothetical protein
VDEVDRRLRRGAPARVVEHRPRNVEADHAARQTDPTGDRDRRAAATAPDVDRPLAGSEAGAVEQRVGDRREDEILLFVEFEPALRGRAVPVSDLLGIVGGSRRHGDALSGTFSSWRS